MEFALAETPAADIMQGMRRGDMGVAGWVRLLANNVSGNELDRLTPLTSAIWAGPNRQFRAH